MLGEQTLLRYESGRALDWAAANEAPDANSKCDVLMMIDLLLKNIVESEFQRSDLNLGPSQAV